MISKTYYKYIWLLDTLLKSCPLTFDEINMLWEDCPAHDGPIPIRTFHEYRKGIKEMFGVDIECDRSKNVYYVKNPEVLDDNKLAKWLLRKYSIPQEFATFSGMKDRILLEEMPTQSTNFLDLIIEAMQQNVELRIEYQRLERETEECLQTFHVQPYVLKVYDRRWYLLGYLKERNALRTIALDRILNLKMLPNHFDFPKDFDAKQYFANSVGIYVDEAQAPQVVRIRVVGSLVEYLRSSPMHCSQEEVLTKYSQHYSEFQYRLCLTPELTSRLLSMGESVEVLEPMELRDEMKKKINTMFNLYKN